MKGYECECVIHSLGGKLDTATIYEKINDEQYAAEYKGKFYTCIFNVFVCRYYVDDKYGALPDYKIPEDGE
jgi:hypothetical protein